MGVTRDQSTVLTGGVARAEAPFVPVAIGDVVAGYRIEAVAGAGGMGVVYRAREAGLERSVALKVVLPELAALPGFRDSFIRESLIAASLEHPSVIPVYRSGEDGGLLYIAMRWVDGVSLEGLIARDGRLPPARAARIVAQVAGALDAAHERGLVHRDVKPANVMIADPDGDEHVYLTDFGLSVRGADGPAVAAPGRWAGTPGYLAPEQIRGGSVDARADVYALGCVLVRALTGRPPFAGSGEREMLAAHLTEPPPRVTDIAPELPPALDDVIRRALAKRPQDRFTSAGDLALAALAARFDVYLCHHPTDREAAEAIVTALEGEGLLPWLASRRAVPGRDPAIDSLEALRAADACAVVLGRQGLGEWARADLAAAEDVASRDRGFRILTVLLPGAPEPFDPSLALLAARTWVDMRAGIDDADARRDLVRALGREAPGGAPLIAIGESECPYRGLEAFDEDHAELFFGREEETARAVERLRGARFLAVIGPSGSGKSSLLRAGVLPALRRGALPGSEDWTVRVLVPGARPLAALASQMESLAGSGGRGATVDDLLASDRALDLAAAAALPNPADRLVLVVDQLEEVFTRCDDEAERAAFLRNLHYAAAIPGGPVVVLLSLRADFYHRCAEDPELRAIIAAQQLLLGPLGPEGLRRAIEEPARRSGLELEPGLTRRILVDVADRPGALPLLEHLLLELWHRRRGRALTLEAYAASGGVEGALAKRANAVYGALAPERRRIARRVLLRLVQPGQGTEDTRRRASLPELVTRPEEEPEVRAVVGAMAEARLLTTGRDEASGAPMVEITHEALIRGWPELRGWIDDERESILLHLRLTEAARDWEAAGREEGLLYRGARLAAWQDRDAGGLSDLERSFLAAGRDRAARERAAGRRRLRLVVAGLAAALGIITAVAVIAVLQRNEAANERDLARSREIAASARAALSSDPELAVLLAERAYGVRHTVEAENVLRQAVAASSVRAALRDQGPVDDAAFSGDGSLVATGGDGGAVRVWEPRSGRSVTLRRAGAPVYGVALSPDGRLVAAGDGKGVVRLWDWRRRRLLGRVRLASTGSFNTYVGDLAFLAGGRLVVAAGGGGILAPVTRGGGRVRAAARDGVAAAWDWKARRIVALVRTRDGIVTVSSTRDGRVLLGGGGDVTLWDPMHPGRRPLRVVSGVGDQTISAIAPDGHRVLYADSGGAVAGRRRPGGAPLRLPRAPAVAFTIAVSPDGRHAVSAGPGGSVTVWDLDGVEPSVALRGNGGPVESAVFSSDGERVLTAADDGTVRIWAWRQAQPTILAAAGSPVLALAFRPDGRALIEATGDGSERRWELPEGRPSSDRGSSASIVTSGAIARDGRRTAWGDQYGGVAVSDRGEVVASAQLLADSVQDLAMSPDGRLVASGGQDGTVRVWDLAGGRPPTVLRGHRGAVQAVAFGPDGRLVASGGQDGTVRVWRWTERVQALVEPVGRSAVAAVALSPNGGQVAAGDDDGAVRVWRCDVCGPVPEVLDLARGRVTRDLTGSERQIFLNSP